MKIYLNERFLRGRYVDIWLYIKSYHNYTSLADALASMAERDFYKHSFNKCTLEGLSVIISANVICVRNAQ